MRPTLLLLSIGLLIACGTSVDRRRAIHTPVSDSTLIAGEVDSEIIHDLMDAWHKAAGDADGATYFGMMADEAIYLGTDKAERWTKAEFKGFATPYFERGKAWDFSAHERHILFAENGRTAWLDEQLDTWMGACRGSAVLLMVDGEWKIVHYDLSYMVQNEQMDAVIELTGSAAPRVQAIDSMALE